MTDWLVFGRTEYAEPLRQQGTLAAVAAEAPALAQREYGDAWVELTLVPQAAVRWIFRPGEKDDG